MDVLALRPLVDLDAGLRGERPEGVGERDAVALHHEAEDVAAEATAEALPGVAARGHGERGCLLAVERAEPLEGRARLLQLHRLADHIDDVQPALDFACDPACRDPRLRCPPQFCTRQNAARFQPSQPDRDLSDMAVGLSSLDKPLRVNSSAESAS